MHYAWQTRLPAVLRPAHRQAARCQSARRGPGIGVYGMDPCCGASTPTNENPLDLVGLRPLMEETAGSPDILIGIIDGPVLTSQVALAGARFRQIGTDSAPVCLSADSAACLHGTFVAGVLAADRGSQAPSICPGCTFLVRPIFSECEIAGPRDLIAEPSDLARAVIETVNGGARVINMSVALARPSSTRLQELDDAFNYAAKHGVILVAAAGNQGTLGSSPLTRHPWVIPVVAVDLAGAPIRESNLGASIGDHGLAAPGDRITSLGSDERPIVLGGTSAAAPFVTGAIALLCSCFPKMAAGRIKDALRRAAVHRGRSVVPPLLDAWAARVELVGGGK
jgi:hypothetical protein